MHLDKIDLLPAYAAAELGTPGAIVIGVLPDGGIVINAHGIFSHKRTVEALSIGIHAVLKQHDEAVRAGRAGAEAQERQQRYENAGTLNRFQREYQQQPVIGPDTGYAINLHGKCPSCGHLGSLHETTDGNLCSDCLSGAADMKADDRVTVRAKLNIDARAMGEAIDLLIKEGSNV